MSTPAAAADLSLCDRAVLLVLSELLPPDSPRELTIPQIAETGGFLPRRVSASLTALERAGLIQRIHSGRGCAPTILRPSTPLPVSAPSGPLPRRAAVPRETPPRRPIMDMLCEYLRTVPPGTVLTTSMRKLAAAIGRSDSTTLRGAVSKLVLAGLLERLPGRVLRLRLCGPFPVSERGPVSEDRSASEPTPRVLTQVRAVLRDQPLGVELSLTVKQLAATVGRSPMGVARALRTLEAEGTIRRTSIGQRSGLILLAPPDAPPPPTPAPPTVPPPTLPPAQKVTPHATLWKHLRASLPGRNPTDWLLSGVTVTVLADTTVLTCADAARTSFARAWHRTLAGALHALELPHALVIMQAPADVAPALPAGALDAALASTSMEALLDALRPLPNLTEVEARALLAQVQAGQAAQERQAALKESSADLAVAMRQGYAAWERLILSHIRLIVRIARRRSARLSLEERVQAGMLGLMQAIAQCDGRLTCSFVLFAHRAAHRAIHDALDTERPIRRTRSRNSVALAQRQLEASLGREPTVVEIAHHAGMHRETVVAVLEAEAGIASLDAPLRVDEDATLADFVADDQALTPEALLLAREAVQERRKELGGALAGLEPDERRVIALRFGLEGEAHTVTEAARALGWTVPRVRQVEAEVLAALRKRMGASTEGVYR